MIRDLIGFYVFFYMHYIFPSRQSRTKKKIYKEFEIGSDIVCQMMYVTLIVRKWLPRK